MILRVRASSGTKRVTADGRTTFAELKDLIAAEFELPASSVQELLRCPPRGKPAPLAAVPTASVSEMGLVHGDMLEMVIGDPSPKIPPASGPAVGDGAEGVASGDMVRRVIPSDNSCLFNAVGCSLFGSREHGQELRELCAATVASDPDTFSEAVVGRSDYVEWILDPQHWGGAIELSILCKHYETEIVAFDVQTEHQYCYGEGSGYANRIFLLYDGVHYDSIVKQTPGGDVGVFGCEDAAALTQAAAFVSECHRKREFTDLTGMSIRCGVCSEGFRGTAEAVQHQKDTGHTNFQEIA